MKELRLTGVMYPPPEQFDKENPRSLRHECEEFIASELDALVEQLVGLPLLVEHRDTELVGSVECAKKTIDGAVEIEAVIKASCPKGRQAIKEILEKKLVGLSLSHEYKLSSPADSETSAAIRLSLVDGDGWHALTNTSGHTIQKKLREVSVCTDPARKDCQISSTVCASAQKQNQDAINIQKTENGVERIDTRIVGLFSCSMETSVMATDQQNEGGAGEVAAADAAEAPQEVAQQEVAPVEIVAPVAIVPPVEEAPVVDETEETVVMQKAMQDALERMEKMKKIMDEDKKQQDIDINKLRTEAESEKQAKLVQEAEILELKKTLAERKKSELQTAKQQRDTTFNRLTATLSALEGDLGKRDEKPTDPKAQLIFESKIAEKAIKQLESVCAKANVMEGENKQLKRQHENIEHNLCNFEVGRVDASAATKRQNIGSESFIEWKSKNPQALKWQVDAQLQKCEEMKHGTVRVNASRLKWNEPTEAQDAGPARPLTSSIYTSYPEMASKLMQLNTGKLIDGEETVRMMQSTQSDTNLRSGGW